MGTLFRGEHDVLDDYLRSFWRGVLRNKMATFINVGGLALGLAVFFALSFYVKREFSWDAHWDGADRIYRTMGQLEGAVGGNGNVTIDIAPYVMGTELQSRNPDAFEAYARVYNRVNTLEVAGIEYPDQSRLYVDPALLDLLQFETLEGSLQQVFSDPSSIAISAPVAQRVFGAESPLGKVVTFRPDAGDPVDFVVRAVYRLPAPTALDFPFLAMLDPVALEQFNLRADMWQPPRPAQPPQAFTTAPAQPLMVRHYFKAREGVDVAAIAADLNAFMNANGYAMFGSTNANYLFQPLRDVHLTPAIQDAAGSNVLRLASTDSVRDNAYLPHLLWWIKV